MPEKLPSFYAFKFKLSIHILNPKFTNLPELQDLRGGGKYCPPLFPKVGSGPKKKFNQTFSLQLILLEFA